MLIVSWLASKEKAYMVNGINAVLSELVRRDASHLKRTHFLSEFQRGAEN
jgi:hypothetical protein